MAKKDFFHWYDEFKDGARAFAKAAVESAGKWYNTETAAAGTPTYVVSSSGLALTMEATNEAQNLCLSHHDILTFDLSKTTEIEYILKTSGTAMTSGSRLSFGVGVARHDTPTSVAKYVFFSVIGATSTTLVVIEASDGTNTYTTIATGKTLINAYKRFVINFSRGLSDVRFFIAGEPVATTTTFDLSALTATYPVQPIVQIQKTASTNTNGVTLKYASIRGRSGLALS
jgi:hypothetical protein